MNLLGGKNTWIVYCQCSKENTELNQTDRLSDVEMREEGL